MIPLEKLNDFAHLREKENLKFIKKLKTRLPKSLDMVVKDLHHETFSKIDCLDCANCCKTLGPRLTAKDIDQISNHLKVKPEFFIKQYLIIDEDRDYVFKSMPCPFLENDNYCRIYKYRPKACAGYPHTESNDFHKNLLLTVKNTFTCPAVYEIVENLKKIYS